MTCMKKDNDEIYWMKSLDVTKSLGNQFFWQTEQELLHRKLSVRVLSVRAHVQLERFTVSQLIDSFFQFTISEINLPYSKILGKEKLGVLCVDLLCNNLQVSQCGCIGQVSPITRLIVWSSNEIVSYLLMR